jgi:2-methylisocitrate lyase-like PEP mutase family enzyme
MSDQVERAQEFANLHIKGEPIIIYNAWDGGSAKAIASAGAKAIATGDHPVGFSHGYGEDDFSEFTFDIYLPTIKEISKRVGNLPFSVDINNANGLTGDELKDRIRIILETGAVGINYEDQLPDGSGVQPIEEQVKRIKTIRDAADDVGVPLFINSRTDIFALGDSDKHSELLSEAIERGKAYKEAGGNSFFVPGLVDIDLIKQLCDSIELPVNIIKLPGAPTTKELISAGVGRVSYGPMPQMAMIAWLKDQASSALNYEN